MTLLKNTAVPPPLNKKRYYNSIGYKYCESGRSLVEMLGVLAVMGILSMAGIWAYNAAMDKLKANTIINEAQKRAVVIAGQIGLMGSTHPTLGEFKENTFGGGTFSTNVITEGLYKQFGIQVSGVSKSVCQDILNSIGEGSAIRRLSAIGNATEAITGCAEDNSFLIVYNNDMSSGGTDVGYCDNGTCQTVCGECIVENGNSHCINECPANVGGQCSTDQDCSGECVGCVIPSGQTNGTCQTCQRVAYLESTGKQWIDTGLSAQDNCNVLIDFQYTKNTSNTWLYGYWKGGTKSQLIGTYNNKFHMYAGSDNTSVWVNDWDYDENRHTAGWYNGHYIYDNATITKTPDLTANINYAIILFARTAQGTAGQGNMYAKVYSCKMWNTDSTKLLRDFIPVHAPFKETGKQNCMYDRVSKTLFCNAGNGNDFTVP